MHGSDGLFKVTDTTATAQDVLSIADGGAITFRNQTNSTAAFQIQNAAATNIFTVDTTNAAVNVAGDIIQTGNGVNALGDQESMVPNSGFEVNNDGTSTVADTWTFTQTTGTPTAATTASTTHGSLSQQITATTVQVGTLMSACFPVSTSKAYNLSFRHLASVTATGAVGSNMLTYGNKANCVANISAMTVNGTAASNTTAGTVTEVGATVNTGASANWARVTLFLDTPSANTTVTFDAVRFTPNAAGVGIDLAENFPAAKSDNLQPGEVVSFGNISFNGDAYAVRSSRAYDGKAFGVVSTQPGITLDDGKGYEHVTVALAGRVPVKVSDENGPIAIGDPITASSTPGVGMKATATGRIIGYAMSEHNESGEGTVVVYVNPGYYEGEAMTETLQPQDGAFDSLVVSGNATIGGNLNVSGHTTLTSLEVTGDVMIGGTLTVVSAVVTGNITVEGKIITKGEVPEIAAVDTNLQYLFDTIEISGTDTTGTIRFKTGASLSQDLSGEVVKVTLNDAFNYEPKVFITGNNHDSAVLGAYIVKTADGFKLISDEPLQPDTVYEFEYLVIGTEN